MSVSDQFFASPPPLDPRERRFLLPTRVVWQTPSPSVTGAENLLVNDNGQALVQRSAHKCVLRHEGEAPGLLLDFGRELHGGIQLVVGPTAGNRPVRCRLRFGESASEAMGEPNNDHAMHDTTIWLPSMGAQEYGLTGFRFVRLDVLDEGTSVELAAWRAVSLMRPLARLGSFECSDARLNDIWRTGADTVHLCMQDYVWDGIKRDRLVWIGDMHPEVAVISAVFGNHDIVPRSLDWVRDHTPLPEWMNGISSYSMWWVRLQYDWYLAHGQFAYLQQQRAYLLALLDKFVGLVGSDGVPELTGRIFLDWPSQGDEEAVRAGLHALLTMTLDAGRLLCDLLGEESAGARGAAAAARLRTAAPPLIVRSKQASSLMALAGLHGAAEANQQVLAVQPLRGVSTFYGYYVLQARAEAGDFAGCLEVIRRYWGAMLDLGATSFWEDFDLAWMEGAARIDDLVPEGKHDVHREYGDHCYKGLRHSLCHGWASGPTAWLSQHVLGVRPLLPGCARVAIAPHLEDLEWARGTYPTPHGVITIEHERASNGETRSTVQAPDGVEAIV